MLRQGGVTQFSDSLKSPSSGGGTTSSRMRSRQISKRVLASPEGVIMVWLYSSFGGRRDVAAVSTPTSVSNCCSGCSSATDPARFCRTGLIPLASYLKFPLKGPPQIWG
ncbi:hypothetical protein AVEN_267579-1 [Araneus ventricosus]|uniref:Uncharacterized protein n=1 Tax=Araneus ventricosus TaxID=182803 RepID=A0A4Y2JYY2_ARAVE|nr:hypothetical protein AVEN_267579-1 [Araneus ventricosus]